MEPIKIQLRKARQEDCEDVFRWFNDEQSRDSRFNSSVVNYKSHCEWFSKSLVDVNRHIFIGVDENNNKVGMVRLDKINEHVAEFDINLDPAMRGKGHGKRLLEIAYELFAHSLPGNLFIAKIKKCNIASVKTFTRAGFFEICAYLNVKRDDILVLGKIMHK